MIEVNANLPTVPRTAFVILLLAISAGAEEPPQPAVLPFTPQPSAAAVNSTGDAERFTWRPALDQSYRFLMMETSVRVMFQRKTRRELGGPFFHDYFRAIHGLHGWQDGDSWLTNYIGHPVQGAVSGYISIQNSPQRFQEFSLSTPYWTGRLKAMLWSAAYSANFELGPISEASIGNVGIHPGTSGYVDHVITPTGGFAMMIGEDAVDHYFIGRWESHTGNDNMRRFLRVALNPSRSLANVLRGKTPWFRDTRPLNDPGFLALRTIRTK